MVPDSAVATGNPGGILLKRFVVASIIVAAFAGAAQDEPFNSFVVLVIADRSLAREASMDGGDMLLLSGCDDVNVNVELRVLFVFVFVAAAVARSTSCFASATATASASD